MSKGATGSRPDPVVDVHAHVLPPAMLRSGQPLRVGERTLPAHPPALSDLTLRLRTMDALGVDTQVISPWIELTPVGLDPEASATHVRRVNDAVAAEVARAPDRLVGMAMLPQHDGDEAARELERAVVDLGMCGALLTTSGAGLSLAAPALDPLWSVAQHRRAVLMTHPFRPAETARTQAEHIGDLVGTPVEGTLALVGLLRSGVLDRFPALRILAVHGGGALPPLLGRLEALWELSGAAPGGARPTELVGRLYLDTLTHDERALRWLCEAFGPRRLLMGSDFPFPTGEPRPVERVRGLQLDARHVAGILGRTAATLLADVDATRG